MKDLYLEDMAKKKAFGRFITKMMNPITHGKDVDDAFEEYEKTKQSIDNQLSVIQRNAALLYAERKVSVKHLQEFSEIVSTIQNCPISITNSSHRAIESASGITDAWELEDDGISGGPDSISKNSKAASVIGATGALAGSLTATLGPSSLMAIATTFGTASTGTAISALTGAAASNAALAWLGGGAVAVGGTGVAGGSFIMGLLGPIGIGIAGAATFGSALIARSKNNKNLKLIKSQIDDMKKVLSRIRKANKSVKEVLEQTRALNQSFEFVDLIKGTRDYHSTVFPKERLFEYAATAKLLGKMTTEEISL